MNMSTAATASKNAAPTWDEEVDFPNEALASETESDSAVRPNARPLAPRSTRAHRAKLYSSRRGDPRSNPGPPAPHVPPDPPNPDVIARHLTTTSTPHATQSDGEAARWSRGVPTGPAGAAIDDDRPGSSRGSDDSAMMTKGAEGADTAVHDGEVRRVCIEGEGKMRFVPPTLEIRAGDVVRWEQDKRCPVNHFLEVVSIVDDAEVQIAESSDVLTPATPWHHRFDVPGEYHYRSLVHTYMKGTVRVAPRILGSLKSDPSDPYEFVDEVGETDLSWLGRSRIKNDHASSSSDDETRDHATNEYSLLPSGDEEEGDGAEAAGTGRGKAPASVSAANKLPTKEESDAMIDQLLRLGKSAKDGGSNADALKSMDAAFGSLDLLSSGKAMPMLNEMRKKRMTMGSSDRGDAGIWQRHKKESSPTFKQLIKPPPDAVRATLEQIHDEERKAATDKVKARMRAMGRSDGVGPASSLMSETLSDTDFPPEFGLEKLLRDGETFFCKHCGKPFASTMNMTRHAMCGDCPQKNGDSKKKKKDPKKGGKNKSAPPATREQLAGFLVEMTGQDRVDFLKSVGTDEHGQEWQTKQLLLRAMKNRHDDHFLVMLHPERIYKPGDGKERQLRRVASAVSSHLGLAKNKAEGLASVFDRYTSHGAFLRDMIETPEEMRDADIMQWQGVLEALKVASEETFLQSGKYGGVVDNPDTMCRGVNQEAALAYMTEVALVDAYVAARSAEAEAEQRKLLAELDEAAADDERRERRRLKEKAKKAKAKAKKKGLDTSSPPGSEPSNAEKEKESEADFEKDASDEDDDDDEEAERERERLEAEVEAARLAKRRAAEEAEALAELAEREARELAAAERRMEMEYVAREKARVAAEEEKARRKSGEFSVVGGGGGIAGGGLLGVMANGVVASPYGKAKPKKPTPAPQKQPQGSPPERSPNKPPAHPTPSTDGDAGKQKRERFVPPLPPGPPPAAARSPDGAGKAAASGAGSTQAPVAKGSGSTQAPVVKPRPAAFDPSKQPTRSAPAPVVSAASVAPPSAHKAVHRAAHSGPGGKGPGSSYRSGGNTSATSMSESDYRSSDAEGGPGGVKMSRKARAAAKAAAKAEAARSGRESGNSSQSEQYRTSGGNIEVYKSEPKERLSSTETEKPERYSKPLSEVEGMLLAAAERTETQARRARAAAEEAEASLRAKEAARMAGEEAERRAEEAEAKKADERKVATVAATAPRVKFCTQCGERQTEGARFCSGCGVAVAKPADAPAAAASPPGHHPGATQAPQTGHHPGHYPGGHPPYGSQTAPPPPFVGGYPVGAPTPPGVPPGDYGPEYNALYMQHYHAALATITAQQQQYMGFAPSDPSFAQGGYPPLQQGPMQGAYPPPGAYGVPGATAGHGAPPPPKPKGPPPGPKGPKHSKKAAKGADSSG